MNICYCMRKQKYYNQRNTYDILNDYFIKTKIFSKL